MIEKRQFLLVKEQLSGNIFLQDQQHTNIKQSLDAPSQ
jgi:hypothetical protein